MNCEYTPLSTSPPPYQEDKKEKADISEETASPPPAPPQRNFAITHTDVPQWRWSTNQCRKWLESVYTEIFNLPGEEALFLAIKFEGSGPMIYITSREEWVELLGYQRGRSLYALLVTVKNEPGAMPSSITVDSDFRREG
ncbi:uncharacterized protein PAC_03222 [Phialocephala subalpina]|uniref:Uncharacterized protein n=1 Tax=Phialocephala subalpina TaxID=576137 RepID=A0A1L7WKP0_9HELO|nr:uncharacterized protein PAC_03222 [Phialocephala subalpina]